MPHAAEVGRDQFKLLVQLTIKKHVYACVIDAVCDTQSRFTVHDCAEATHYDYNDCADVLETFTRLGFVRQVTKRVYVCADAVVIGEGVGVRMSNQELIAFIKERTDLTIKPTM